MSLSLTERKMKHISHKTYLKTYNDEKKGERKKNRYGKWEILKNNKEKLLTMPRKTNDIESARQTSAYKIFLNLCKKL